MGIIQYKEFIDQGKSSGKSASEQANEWQAEEGKRYPKQTTHYQVAYNDMGEPYSFILIEYETAAKNKR